MEKKQFAHLVVDFSATFEIQRRLFSGNNVNNDGRQNLTTTNITIIWYSLEQIYMHSRELFKLVHKY